ncbi:MAG: hypothetical protein ACRYFR_12915 [Janthinobacterium lividum]
MQVLLTASPPRCPIAPLTAALVPVNLADLTAKQLAGLLAEPPSHLLVDCGGRLAPHSLGVCRFVSQLLQLRKQGTSIQLCNVHPGLRRCLDQMELGALFHLPGPDVEAVAAPLARPWFARFGPAQLAQG